MTDTTGSPAEIARKKLAAVIEDLESNHLGYPYDYRVFGRLGGRGETPPKMTWADLKALATPDTTDKIETGAGGLVCNRSGEEEAPGSLKDITGMSAAPMDTHTLRVHFRRPITQMDLVDVMAAVNASLSPTGDGGRARGLEEAARELATLIEAIRDDQASPDFGGPQHERKQRARFLVDSIALNAEEVDAALDALHAALSQAGDGEQGGGASREGCFIQVKSNGHYYLALGCGTTPDHRKAHLYDRAEAESIAIDREKLCLVPAQSPTSRGEG